MRRFQLVRFVDHSGVSGTGVVAEGVEFTDGGVALHWTGGRPATAVWPDLGSVVAVHGHSGSTVVRWLDAEPPPVTPNVRVSRASRAWQPYRPMGEWGSIGKARQPVRSAQPQAPHGAR
ncbi:MAG: hypothetical protein ACRDO1_03255 [Nocardioidaceae bacterium]